MGQALKDVPRTRAEYERQKGPTPPIAIALILCLMAAGLAFFAPAWIGIISGYLRGE